MIQGAVVKGRIVIVLVLKWWVWIPDVRYLKYGYFHNCFVLFLCQTVKIKHRMGIADSKMAKKRFLMKSFIFVKFKYFWRGGWVTKIYIFLPEFSRRNLKRLRKPVFAFAVSSVKRVYAAAASGIHRRFPERVPPQRKIVLAPISIPISSARFRIIQIWIVASEATR